MNTTNHQSLTALFKVIKQEQPSQYAVTIEIDEDGKKSYQLSRPFVKEVVEGE